MAAYALGRMFNGFFKLNRASLILDKVLFDIVFGLGFFSLLIFGIGLTGLIYPGIFWGLLLILSAAAAYLLISDPAFREYRWPVLRVPDLILVLVIVLTCAMYLALSFLPVTNADALNHIITPLKYYIQHHTIYDLSKIIAFSSYPQIVGMLDMFVMSLTDEIAINHLHVCLGFLACLMIYCAARKTNSRSAGLLCVITVLTSGVFLDMAPSAKIDIGTALFTSALFYCLVSWMSDKNPSWFYASTVFSAFSFGTKYNGGLVLLFPVLLLGYSLITKKIGFADAKKLVFGSAVIYAVLILPWCLLNYTHTGNPLSPFGAELFKDRSITPQMSRDLKGIYAHLRAGYFKYIKNVFLGMPVLFFIFFSLRPKKHGPKNDYLSMALVLGAVFFLLGDYLFPHSDRIFFPAFMLFFFAVGNNVDAVSKYNRSWFRNTALVVFFCMIGYGIYSVGNEIFRKENFPYLSGAANKDAFLEQNVLSYAVTRPLNVLLGKGEKVLTLREPRSYYFDQEIINDFSYIGYSILETNDPQSIVSGMKKNNIKYIIYTKEPCFRPFQNPVLNDDAARNKYFELLIQRGACSVYKLRGTGSAGSD